MDRSSSFQRSACPWRRDLRVKCLAEQGFGASKGYLETGHFPDGGFPGDFSGVGLPVPFWVYWTSPEKVAMALTIYRFWLGDVWHLMTHVFDVFLRFPFWCSIPIARRLLSPFCRTTSATIRRETHGSRGDDLHVGVVAGDSKHILETSKSSVIGVIFLAAVCSVWSQDLSRLDALACHCCRIYPTARKPNMWYFRNQWCEPNS